MKRIVLLLLCSCAYSPSEYNDDKKDNKQNNKQNNNENEYLLVGQLNEPEYKVPTELGTRCKIGGHKNVDWCWAVVSKCWETGIMKGRCSFNCSDIEGAPKGGEEARCIQAGGVCLSLDNDEGWDNRKVCVPTPK